MSPWPPASFAGLTAEFSPPRPSDAPVRTGLTRPRRAVAPRLRRRSATLLAGLARRLEPDTRGAS